MTKKRVAVALSGGVDSSIAALLLKEAGYEVIGLTMRLWPEEKSAGSDRHHYCYPPQDIQEAEQICLSLGIPFHIISLENEFKQHVIDYFCQEYMQGRTPNPCIACNRYIKFGFLLHRALSLGADYLATGHYAGICSKDGYHLLKGIDSEKDQSYMLYTLSQDILGQVIFPLGNYLKTDVRKLAQKEGLSSAIKLSSQDACFISTDITTFLSHRLTITPGDIVNNKGDILGTHKGTALYTIGQRHGLGIASSDPLYVTQIEPETNKITVGYDEELYSYNLAVNNINWISGKPPSEPMTITAKIRYRSPESTAILYPKANSAEIKFHQAQRAITPGQSIVFYQDNEVLGGGIIEN